MRSLTLSKQVFFRISPTILVTIGLIGILAGYSTNREINNVYDAQMINNAGLLWTLVEDEIKEGGLDPAHKISFDNSELGVGQQFTLGQSVNAYAKSRMARIWQGGKIVMYSDTALPVGIPKLPEGFTAVNYAGEEWRIFNMPIAGSDVNIEVGERTSLRRSLTVDILEDLIVPLLLLTPVIGVFVWLGINGGLGPIHALVQQIRNRSPDDLSPVSSDTLPRDLQPLGKSINQLLQKLDDSLSAERRFADHAAHELRTPLSGLKLQLQMLSSSGNAEERQSIMQDLMANTDRASRLVSQLLNAARVGHVPLQMKRVRIYETVAGVIAGMGGLIMRKRIEVLLEGDENAVVQADEDLLRLVVSNLFENALKYTPAGGNITLNLAPRGAMCLLAVQDSGAGIPEAQRELVFDRFYRLDTPIEGSGLGLSIVAEILHRFSGSISLKTGEGGGLLVEVLIPSA